MNENKYGVKLNENMIDKVLNQILSIDKEKEDQLIWLIGNNIGFKKFKTIQDIKNNSEKFKDILRNESIFDGSLGFSLMNFFNLSPDNILIFEDLNKCGRTVKEIRDNYEQVLSFIPIFDEDSEPYVVDEQIKKFNKLSKLYDITEGRYYEG